MDTGIGLFVYNRPGHLQRVLDGLQKNDIDRLHVFSDGPVSPEERREVERVRSIVRDIDWCDVDLVASSSNKGLARSVVDGVEYLFDRYNRVIILEDDCVPSFDFVEFMNTCLDKYAETPQVMSVSGYSPPAPMPDDYDYDVYFTRRTHSWGWGTWQSAWEQFEQDPMTLAEFRDRRSEIARLSRPAGGLTELMADQLAGETDSWATWWSWAVVKNHGISVNPVDSRVENIGHDGSGTHSGTTDKYAVELAEGDRDLTFPPCATLDPIVNSIHNTYMDGTIVSRLLVGLRKKIWQYRNLVD